MQMHLSPENTGTYGELETAQRYIYRWDRQGRKGQRCKVTARGKFNSIRVVFEDGYTMITSGNAIRRAPDLSDIDGEAMKHLGNVLMLLAELHPDDRTKGLNKAMTFFNEHNPTWQIEPVEGYSSRLVITGPRPLQEDIDHDE